MALRGLALFWALIIVAAVIAARYFTGRPGDTSLGAADRAEDALAQRYALNMRATSSTRTNSGSHRRTVLPEMVPKAQDLPVTRPEAVHSADAGLPVPRIPIAPMNVSPLLVIAGVNRTHLLLHVGRSQAPS